MQYAVADFVARHAIAVLSVIAIATLALSAVAWHVLGTLAPRTWPLAIDLWDRGRKSRFAHWLRELPLVGRFLSSTLTIARYLGIVAIIGFGLSLGALVLFVELADEIGAGESPVEFDVALSAALREHVSLGTLRVFSIITHLGDGVVLLAIGVVVFAVLAVKRLKLLAAGRCTITASPPWKAGVSRAATRPARCWSTA